MRTILKYFPYMYVIHVSIGSLNLHNNVIAVAIHIFKYIMFKGAKLGGATDAMAPLVFWSGSLKKSRKVSKSKYRSSKWHQLILLSLGATDYSICCLFIFAICLNILYTFFRRLLLTSYSNWCLFRSQIWN